VDADHDREADPIAGYDAAAAEIAVRYESVQAEAVHAVVADLVRSRAGGRAMDVGAGSGRDAAWLARLGYAVVAVEPAAGLRAEAQARHAEADVLWLDDRLPRLSATHALDRTLDLILHSGVWMHVRPGDRPPALRTLAALLADDGVLLISHRNPSSVPDRPMWACPEGELERLAGDSGLRVIRSVAAQDRLGRGDVRWTSTVLVRLEATRG